MRLTRRTRTLAIAFGVGIAAVLSLSACSSNQVDANALGMHYSQGWKEGRHFENVVEPGSTDFTVNDVVRQIPIGQRSFIVRQDDKADVNGVISVAAGGASKDAATSGSQLVDFEVATAFALNTRIDDIDSGEFKDGGTARKFFEKICMSYECWFDGGKPSDGWRRMLQEKYYPPLESAFKDEARNYTTDDIVNNVGGTLTALQTKVGERFLEYLERQSGGQYFCGPTFDRKANAVANVPQQRTKPSASPSPAPSATSNPAPADQDLPPQTSDGSGCPPVELIITSADYHNPKVREAREQKKIAADTAAAQSQLGNALKDPNYVKWLEIQAYQACVEAKNIICIPPGSSSAPNISVPAPSR